MANPNDRRYTATHEWVRLEGDTLTLGLTQFAVDELTDITYVEMKGKGTKFKAGDSIGEVESVKAASDIYCPLAGEITEVNRALADDPSLLNSDPLGKGWLVRARTTDKSAYQKLLDAPAFDKHVGK